MKTKTKYILSLQVPEKIHSFLLSIFLVHTAWYFLCGWKNLHGTLGLLNPFLLIFLRFNIQFLLQFRIKRIFISIFYSCLNFPLYFISTFFCLRGFLVLLKFPPLSLAFIGAMLSFSYIVQIHAIDKGIFKMLDSFLKFPFKRFF